MGRLVNAFEQFFDAAGNPLIQGKLYFFESGSSTAAKDTYSDPDESKPNSNPVLLGGDGRAPNVFGNGSYRVVLTDSDDVQILARDPVGGETGTTFGADWNSQSVYGLTDVVMDDGKYWESLNSENFGNRPSTDDGSNWIRTIISIDEVAEISGRIFPIVEDLKLATIEVGTIVSTKGYYAPGDGGGSAYLVASSQAVDGFGDHALSNGNVALIQSAGGINGKQFGMVSSSDSTDSYNAAVAYISSRGLTLDLLGESYDYDIAVSSTGVSIDGFDHWGVVNGTLNRTSVYALTETATIHKITNCNDWSIDLNVTGPATVYGGGSIGTETNKGYLLAWVEENAERFKVSGIISDNFSGLLTGVGPSTIQDKSVKDFEADICIKNSQYGVNCANRGDIGRVRVVADKSHRPYFCYGVDDHDIDISVTTPGTVSTLITAYDFDTTNIRGAISILYSGDAESRGTQNGGVDITTTGTLSATGKIDGIDLKVFARSEGVFGGNNYRSVVGFQSDTVPQRIQNVDIDVDIEGWEGNNTFRPPIGYVEQASYDGSGNPIFAPNSVEPVFDNINISGRCVNSSTVNNNVEMATSLLEGKMTFNIDGSGFFRVRNHSTDPSARIQVDRSTFKNASGGAGASIDYAYMATSKNTWIGKSYNESIGVISLPGQAEYQREDETFFGTAGGAGSPVAVKIAEIPPVNFGKYLVEGFSNNHTFSGVLQSRTTGGLLDSNSTMLSFVSTANGGVFGAGNIAVSGVNAVGGFLEITFTSAAPADLDFIGFSVKPYASVGSF